MEKKGNEMKKILLSALTCVAMFLPMKTMAIFEVIDFEYINETCSSLDTYQNDYSLCVNNGFSYTTVEVEYFTEDNESVILTVRQAKLGYGSVLLDSHIKKVKINCDYCEDGNLVEVLQRISVGLSKAIVVESLKVKEEGSSSFIPNLVKDIFVGVTSATLTNVGEKLLEDSLDGTQSKSAYIMIYNTDGMPIGSGYILDGVLFQSISLLLSSSGDYRWTGTLTAQELADIVSNDAWGPLINSQVCTIVYTGTADQMEAQLVCFFN
jgi:hypothetical protein